jgi:hypothetical protein
MWAGSPQVEPTWFGVIWVVHQGSTVLIVRVWNKIGARSKPYFISSFPFLQFSRCGASREWELCKCHERVHRRLQRPPPTKPRTWGRVASATTVRQLHGDRWPMEMERMRVSWAAPSRVLPPQSACNLGCVHLRRVDLRWHPFPSPRAATYGDHSGTLSCGLHRGGATSDEVAWVFWWARGHEAAARRPWSRHLSWRSGLTTNEVSVDSS